MEFLLIIGTDHSLASTEIETIFPKAKIKNKGIYLQSFKSETEAIDKTNVLGGAIKLLVKKDVFSDETILSEINQVKNFSISYLPANFTESKNICETIKQKSNQNLRFILPKDYYGLSPLIVDKEKIKEIFIFEGHIWSTIWVQDYQNWIKKDRHLPFANAKAGLLPPKIARILINLSGISQGKDKTLLDPFCGSGRLIIEALELKFNVFGSDISLEQIKQTQSNLNALGLNENITLFQSDATQIKNHLKPNSIDLIVTEPFLGRPKPRPDRIPDMIKGLEKLYLGALKAWLPILKHEAVVVMVFPIYKIGEKTLPTSRIIDDPHLIGYNVKTRNLTYSRPEALVQREIVILEKK
jgi:tRNA G10  N-methylase Trm11